MDSCEMRQNLIDLFTERMPGGAFVYRAGEGHELLYANQNMVRLFECDSYEEFIEFVGNSFDGIVNATQLQSVQKEIDSQIYDSGNAFDHVYYHIRTKKGNIRLMEDYGTLVRDEVEGDLFYVFVISREYESESAELDRITGLYGKGRFRSYVNGVNDRLAGTGTEDYAIVYLNFVNFKLLNINKGVAEGDACLMIIAEILGIVFEDAFVSRLSDDHFAVFTKYEQVYEKTEEVAKVFREKYGSHYNIVGKYGIYRFTPNGEFNMESALSHAKVACDYIKNDPQTDIIEYTELLEERMKTEEYVLRRFSEALENEWIKVYFQPVIRTLTEQLCGVESLVRWIDPEVGFLPPDQFIGVLEKNNLIHKLDSYVVERVCRYIHEREEKKLPVVPASVNFSRLDFILCDMLSVVETAVEKYDVPRDFIHIEITESMIASDEDLMNKVIADFRNAGYEIWMDDFGSGYSSLTLLKDFEFDMLKLDMRFLTPFTEKAKDIVRATITMAKDIGIHTLAEGVETREQLDFLTQVGCGKIQGYYYGKPEPVDDMFVHMQENGIAVEERRWRRFYETASLHARYTDTPLEIVEYGDEEFNTLFMNKAYKEQIFEDEPNLRQTDNRIYRSSTEVAKRYREYAEYMKKTGNLENFYYTEGGNYFCFRGQVIATNLNYTLFTGTITNITIDQKGKEKDRLDARVRSLTMLFDMVHLINVKKNTASPLFGSFRYAQNGVLEYNDLRTGIDEFARSRIFPPSQEEYIRFMDPTTMVERIEESGKGYISKLFRVKDDGGTYYQKEISLMLLPRTGKSEVLYCLKDNLSQDAGKEETTVDLKHLLPEGKEESATLVEYANLWDNMIWNSGVKFFWKDAQRRFRGVSQSFLDFYGMQSVDEVIGKTDEDMGWHVDNGPYQGEELDILRNGKKVLALPGQCIVRGVIHNIICYKMPIYGSGKIIGLVGYFVDNSEEREHNWQKNQQLDNVTGLMSIHSFLDAMIDYAMQFGDNGRNYGVIILKNDKHRRIQETLGEDFAKEVLRGMGEEILQVTGQTCAVARVKESVFSVLTYVEKKQDLEELAKAIVKRLNKITKIDGTAVTLRAEYATRIRTESGITDENIYLKTLEDIMEE